ncbi:hypothetical protein LTR66_000192 [Elasticomyces elasticus]|nr:hypothetical protein LTR66_000192 [Elasticomyces elasticus]
MEARSKTFQQLKPPCVALSQAALKLSLKSTDGIEITAALDSLLRVLNAVADRPDALDSKLADYAFFPLSQVLKESQKLTLRALETSLLCVAILIRAGWKQDIAPNLSAQLIILLSFLGSKKPVGLATDASTDELQSAAFACLTCLFSALRSSELGRKSLVETANIPSLGHLVTVLLDALSDVVSPDTQLAAMTALKTFLSCVTEAEVQASFLPGIVSTLSKVLTPNTKSRRSYRLLSAGLQLLSSLLDATVSDESVSKVGKTDPKSRASQKSAQLDEGWVQATASQIKIALANIVRVRQHGRIEVREALLALVLEVLDRCQTSLSNCVPLMLETLLVLPREGIEVKIEEVLQHIMCTNPTIPESLKASLHDALISLTRVMQSNDENAKGSKIQQISTTYALLSSQNIDLSLINSTLAQSLRDSVMINLQEQPYRNPSLLSLGTYKPMEVLDVKREHSSTFFDEILFQRNSQLSVMNQMATFVQSMNSTTLHATATDMVRSLRNLQGNAQLASFWLLLAMIEAPSDPFATIDGSLDLGTTVTHSRGDLMEEVYAFSLAILEDTTAEDTDWRMQALALKALALPAHEEKEAFRTELIDVLYPVLHHLGAPQAEVRSYAITTLNIMAKACGYPDVSVLVVSNVDYLTNAVALKLNVFDISPQAPQVLLMMVKLAGSPLLPYLEDLVGSIFAALENFHGYPALVELLFAVLKTIAEEGVKVPQLSLTVGEQDAQQSKTNDATSVADAAEAVRSLRESLKYWRTTEAEENSASPSLQSSWGQGHEKRSTRDGGIASEQATADDTEQDQKHPPPAPKTYALLLKITQLTQHYLTSSSSSLRGSLLALIRTTMPALARHEDSFLPLINTLWPVVIARLDDPESYVIASTLDVIAIICRHAGAFMRSRIESLWHVVGRIYQQAAQGLEGGIERQDKPAMTMLSSGKEVVRAKEPAVSRYVDTSTRIVQQSLIDMLSAIVEYVGIDADMFDDALDMLAPTVKQRPDVRAILEQVNADALWLFEVRNGAVVPPELPVMPSGRSGNAEFDPPWQFVKVTGQ